MSLNNTNYFLVIYFVEKGRKTLGKSIKFNKTNANSKICSSIIYFVKRIGKICQKEIQLINLNVNVKNYFSIIY